MRKQTRITLFAAVIVAISYGSGPFIASMLEIGDRRGPKIYPATVHESIYMFVWEWTPHDAKKPRLPAVWRSEHRPWFYGQYSKNSDPIWLKEEYEKLRERLDHELANHPP